MKYLKLLLLWAFLAFMVSACSKDNNVDNESDPQPQELIPDSRVFIPAGSDLSLKDLTIKGNGEVLKINDDSTFSSTPAYLVAYNNNDEIVYLSCGSGNEERVLGPVETALALILPTVPNVLDDIDAEHLRALKIMTALLKPTYDLVQAIKSSIKQYNCLNTEAISPQYTAAVRELHHLCGFDREAIEQLHKINRNRKGKEDLTYPYFQYSQSKRIYYDFITIDMTESQLKEEDGNSFWSCKFDVFNDNRFCYTSFTKSLYNGEKFVRYDDRWADTFRHLIKPYNLSECMDLGLISDVAYDPLHFLTALEDYDYSNILEDPFIARFWEPIASWTNDRVSTYDKTVLRDITFDFKAANEHLLIVGPGADDNLFLYNLVKIIVQPLLKYIVKDHIDSDDYKNASELDKFIADFVKWCAETDLAFRADLLQHFKDPQYSNREKVVYAWEKLSDRIKDYVVDELYDKASEIFVKRAFGNGGEILMKEYKKIMDIFKLGFQAADIFEFILDSQYKGWAVELEKGYENTNSSLPIVPGSDF